MARKPSASPDIEGSSLKRKRSTNNDPNETQKRKHKRRTWHDEGREIDEKNGVNVSLAHMGPAQIADLLAKQSKRFQADLSAIEVEDMRIPRTPKSMLPWAQLTEI
jgi:protein CMS1